MNRFGQLVSAGLLLPGSLLLPLHGAIILDGSFESPTSGGSYPFGNSLVYAPSSPYWTFSSAGEQLGTESGIHFETPGNVAQDGLKIGFMQSVGARIEQAIVLPADGSYTLTYHVAGRNVGGIGGNNAGDLTYEVRLGTSVLATDTTFTGQPWTLKTIVFSALAGPYTLGFFGTATPPGLTDQSLLLDNIAIVPEPAAWAAGAGLALAGFALWRRRAGW